MNWDSYIGQIVSIQFRGALISYTVHPERGIPQEIVVDGGPAVAPAVTGVKLIELSDTEVRFIMATQAGILECTMPRDAVFAVWRVVAHSSLPPKSILIVP
jgi:hypothetical protein